MKGPGSGINFGTLRFLAGAVVFFFEARFWRLRVLRAGFEVGVAGVGGVGGRVISLC